MACFGSPKYDHNTAIHILSADSRFPDVRPGHQLSAGNHFLALFPISRKKYKNNNDDDDDDDDTGDHQPHRRKRIRGGDSTSSSSNDKDDDHDEAGWNNHDPFHVDDTMSQFDPVNIVRRLITQSMEWWQDLFQ
jgi:hypothetical protein